MTHQPKIFCAIDTPDLKRAIRLAEQLVPLGIGLKLGLEFFSSHGPQGVETVKENQPKAPIFLDLKFHDIPNTVASAVRAITENLAPTYLNIHASGGAAMMEAAKAACAPNTQLLAVTILTSLSNIELCKIGYREDGAGERVKDLAALSQNAGIDGVVCSAHEIEAIRQNQGSDFVLMVPGIRPAGSDQGDQKRLMAPAEALQKGATHLVIGRPITQAEDPMKAAEEILASI